MLNKYQLERRQKLEKRRTELKDKAKQHFNKLYEKRCKAIDSSLEKPIEPLNFLKKF